MSEAWSHRGAAAIRRMVEYAPASGSLALWVRHQDLPGDARDPPAVTDGLTIFYGSGFATLPLEQQSGLIARLVLHIALRHAPRQRALQALVSDVDAQLYQLCADALVHSMLAPLPWLSLPGTAPDLVQLLASVLGEATDPASALRQWDVERLYRAIDDRSPAQHSGRTLARASAQASQPASGGRRIDGPRAARARLLAAGTTRTLVGAAEPGLPPEAECAQAREWHLRLQRAQAADGEFSLLRLLPGDPADARTPWQQVLRMRLGRALSVQAAPSWSRPSRSWIANQGRAGRHRRMPFEPGWLPGRRVPRLVLMIDVSGSIDAPLLERFAAELRAILRRLEAGLVLVIGDDQVREVVHLRAGQGTWPDLAFGGGGGTDFTPLLREADRHGPDLGILLTDLEGPARFRPAWPVLWAVPASQAHLQAPFGRRLLLD